MYVVCCFTYCGFAGPVLDILENQQFKPLAVVATHHHIDHTGGDVELAQKTGCEVIGPDRNRIAYISRRVKDGDIVAM